VFNDEALLSNMCRHNKRKFVDRVVCVTDVNDAPLCVNGGSLGGVQHWLAVVALQEVCHLPACRCNYKGRLRGLHRCPHVCRDLAWVTALACCSISSHVLCAVVSSQEASVTTIVGL
jgi:hypothetical protein